MKTKASIQDNREAERLFNALSDQTRLSLLQAMKSDPQLCVGELAKKLGITDSAASQHCKILMDSGFLTRQRHGQKVSYVLKPASHLAQQLVRIVV